MKQNIVFKMPGRVWLFGIIFYLTGTLASAQISGSVFRDFDNDGARSTSVPTLTGARSTSAPVELGVGGITVRAYVELSTVPITTTTDANGAYSFSAAQIPANSRVRLEFVNYPGGYFPAPHNGQGGGTTVQFVRAPASDVNTGINYPSDYCQPGPVRLVTPCFVNGDPLKTTDANGSIPAELQSANADAIVAFDYDAFSVKGDGNSSGNKAQFPADHLALGGQTGSVWGLALQRRTKLIFSTAVVKRHAGFGPLGTGGIYVTDLTSTSPNPTTPFLSFPNDLGIQTGPDPHSGLPGNKLFPSDDPGPMQAMGRVGFGGTDMSEDDQTLYVVNLFDRRVYGVKIGVPAQKPNPATDVKSWAINGPGCPQGEFRPWALKVHHGKVYVGGVCSGEYAPTDASTYANAVSSTLLSGHVYELDPSLPNGQFQHILEFPLSFARGSADLTGDCINFKYWQPWTDQFPAPCNANFVMWPQPMVTDLEFDVNGHMIIGMLDRFGHLSGVANHDPSGNGYYDGFTGGDLLRAAPVTNNQFALENNGTVGTQTSLNGVGNNQGPGGGEFYSDDAWVFLGNKAHDEINNGALSLIPGKNEVISSAYDPINEIYKSAGWRVHNNTSGAAERGFVVFIDDAGSFGKASGLGDNKPICDVAPVEIGNRVWFDDNRNGIQDAYEPGIDGLVVMLYDGNTQVASTTTANGGQWYFNNSNVPGGLKFKYNYQVRMDMTQLTNYLLTASTRTIRPVTRNGARLAATQTYFISPYQVSSGTDSGIRDSDAQLDGNTAFINVLTGDAGENNQNYDFSVYACPSIEAQPNGLTVCQGAPVGNLTVKAASLALTDKIKFVCFDTPQTDPTVIYSATNVLGVVTPSSSSTVAGGVLVSIDASAIQTNLNTSVTAYKYVYAVVEPISPMPSTCLPYDGIVITILPKPRATATGGLITCAQPSVTLTAALTDAQNTPIANGVYRWTGPNGFTSTEQNPVVTVAGTYTLNAATAACPDAFTTVTALVEEDKEEPVVVDAYGGVPDCTTCTVTISATVTPANSTLLWQGPNSFTSNQATVDVSEPGFYVLTITGPNGCTASTEVEVQPPLNEEPCPVFTGGSLLTLCSGNPVPPLSVSVLTEGTYAGSSVAFIYSATPLTDPTDAYNGAGTLLDTVTPTNGIATLNTTAIPTTNTSTQTIRRYVYAILSPTPADPTCRPVSQFVLSIDNPLCVPISSVRIR